MLLKKFLTEKFLKKKVVSENNLFGRVAKTKE